jgi:hypothetical protein
MRLLLSIAVLIALPIAAAAQEAAHGVENANSRAPRVIVMTAAPPSVGWERSPAIEVVRLDPAGEALVYAPAQESMPVWRKLDGVDIRYHGIPDAGEASRIRTHSGQADTSMSIPYHDWRSADPGRIPYARTGDSLVAQSWNAFGARFRASRIRYH